MESTSPLSPNVAHERARWLLETMDRERKTHGVRTLSTQGLLLLCDIEKAFCAGAWISVIVLAYAVVDATLRDIATGDYKSKAAYLYGSDADLEWLRNIRNQAVHVSPPGSPPALWKLPPNNLAACQEALEPEARRAVVIAYRQVHAHSVT
jgi:hypothetical protein